MAPEVGVKAMTYDGFTLAAAVAELNARLVGGRIQKIRQHNPTDVTLEIRGPGHTYMLFFSVDARFSRVYLTASAEPVPQEPPNFCMVLRKHAEGGYVTGIEQVGMDRIVKLHIEYPDHTRFTLIMEIMGKHSNLILVDSQGKILGAVKHVGSSISRYRQVLPGREYLPPPGGEKVDLRRLDAEAFDRLWDESGDLRAWLMNTFSGFGPFLADEIVARASEGDAVNPDRVREELLQVGEMARTGAFVPVFITDEHGKGLMVYPMPSVRFPASQQHARASINEALDTLFRSLVSRTALDEERTQVLTAIRRAQAARKQTLKSIERTISESENADRYRQTGELLLANLHSLEAGAKSAALTNFFDPDMGEVLVDLDEKLTPQQNAERYFKRYQKARDAVSTASERRTLVQRDIAALESARVEAESTRTVESLKDLRKMLFDRDLLRQEVVHEKQESEFGGEKIRRMMTPEGWEILYGENSKANDYLTQRVARPNDLWLHARSITGAHVVIRTAGHSGDVPRPVLIRAAKLAAQNSDAKHSSLVPIDHTLRKFVRKPRGSAPGYVIYRNEKTIDVNPKEEGTGNRE
ncbi:MAG: NFACT family protein [Armatimonadetes bacterium]|nr:NFACT family protein [Armatimonadota bacterium]